MTAWESLLLHSTASAGSTAWLHLLSQAGGGGQTIVVGGDASADSAFALSVSQQLILTATNTYNLSAITDMTLTATAANALSAEANFSMEA